MTNYDETLYFFICQSLHRWMKQWAKIVVTLERAVSQTDAQKYLEAYSIPLGPSDDSGYETRGVMVIKSKAKTRAKQRKGAVSNWKRVGRVTLNALKSRGLTGEELRRIMVIHLEDFCLYLLSNLISSIFFKVGSSFNYITNESIEKVRIHIL